MNFYQKLPADILIAFYYELMKNIENRVLTKNTYYELGLIISVASQRELTLERPCDFHEVVNHQEQLDDSIQFTL
jgi:hypothetical protein